MLKNFIISGLVLTICGFTSCKAQKVNSIKTKPNVLFIAIDDLRPAIGVYGDSIAITPNIDALAKQSVVFENAYCQQALCGPSRISLMTSLRPENTGVISLQQPLDKNLLGRSTINETFKHKGYRTVGIGKIYHHRNDNLKGWSKLYEDDDAKRYANPTGYKPNPKSSGKGLGNAYEIGDVKDVFYSDGINTQLALKEIKNKGDEPLFLAVGYHRPHLPFNSPKKYWDLYDENVFTVPSHKKPKDSPEIAFTTWGELRSYYGMPDEGFVNDEDTKKLRQAYYASVSYIDAQIGLLMKELKDSGQLENTIVVLWGDHGFKLGDYGSWNKHTNMEIDTHVPLIVSSPGHQKGVKTNKLVEFVDIFPTLVELCKLDEPKGIEGLSFVPVLENPQISWKKAAFSIYPRGPIMGYSMRTEKWRYTEWKNKETGKVSDIELYDQTKGDIVYENVASLTENKILVSQLSKQLNAGWKEALPK